jgi:hypothetical protein
MREVNENEYAFEMHFWVVVLDNILAIFFYCAIFFLQYVITFKPSNQSSYFDRQHHNIKTRKKIRNKL